MSDKAYHEMSDAEKKKEDWMNSKWRPMMGWMYMLVCICDFVLFPVLWSMVQALMHHPQMTQWNPLTLQGAGLFHIAMGAVLGLAAFGRTQEKIAGANNGGAATLPNNFGSSSIPSAPAAAPSSFGSAPSSFGSAPSSFGAAPSTASVFTSSSGKPMPAPAQDPIL
jgi:hypothetical protein